MILTELILDVLNPSNNEIQGSVGILRDYIIDNDIVDQSLKQSFLKKLEQGSIEKLRIFTLINIGCQFGTKEERKIFNKVRRKVFNSPSGRYFRKTTMSSNLGRTVDWYGLVKQYINCYGKSN